MTYPLCKSATCDNPLCERELFEDREKFAFSGPVYYQIAYQALEPIIEGQDIDSVRNRIPKTSDALLADFRSLYKDAVSKTMQGIVRRSLSKPSTQYSFVVPILAAIEDEPIEDGMTHPVEKILERVLAVRHEDVIMWLRSLLRQGGNPEVAATVLKCIDRVEEDHSPDWGYDLAREALEHEDAEVRDSAIQLFESWGGSEALEALSSHKEMEPWLAKYVQTVIADLSS